MKKILLLAALAFGADTYWINKSTWSDGRSSPPLALSRLDTITNIPWTDSAQLADSTAAVRASIASGGLDSAHVEGLIHDTADTLRTLIAAREPAITAGTTAQYWRGDKTWQTFPTTWAWGSITGTPTTLAGYGIASPLPTSQGGTGSAAWTQQSVIYANGSGDMTALGPNFSTTRMFLTSTGTGIAGNPPQYNTISASDIPTLNQNTTGNAATATKWQTARNITVGSSTGPFDGTADINFTLTAIGAEPALGSSSGIQALFSNGSYRFWRTVPYLDVHTDNRLAKFGSSGAGSVENSSVRDAADANGVWTDENLGVQAAASNVLTDPGLYTGTGVPGSTNHYWKLKLNTSDGLDFWGTGNSVRARLSVSGDWSGNSFVKAGGTSSQILMADGSTTNTSAYQAAGSYLPINNPAFTGTLSGPLATIATGSDGLQIAKRNGSNAGWIGYPGYNTATSGTRAGFWGWSDGAVGIDVASGTTFQLNIGTNQPLWADAGAIHAQVGVHAEGTGAAISAPNGDISTGKAEIVGTQVKTANYTIQSTDPGTTIGNANGITITLPASDTEGKIRYIVAQVGALYIAASNTCQGYGMTLNTGTGTAWVYHSGAGWIRIGTP